jgi:hypothetical protein
MEIDRTTLSAEDLAALETADELGYELKSNFVCNIGFYFVEIGDRDDSPQTFDSIADAWAYAARCYGIDPHASRR